MVQDAPALVPGFALVISWCCRVPVKAAVDVGGGTKLPAVPAQWQSDHQWQAQQAGECGRACCTACYYFRGYRIFLFLKLSF